MTSLPRSKRPALSLLGALSAATALLASLPAQANIDIVATFDSTISGNAHAASIEASINAAIGVFEARIATPITVNIYFQGMSSGLGESDTGFAGLSYYQYYRQLKTIDTAHTVTSAQQTAFASLGTAPKNNSSGNPVTGSATVYITSANARVLGINVAGGVAAANDLFYDSVISLNTSLTYPPLADNGSTYGLQAVALHEIDEALGIGGAGSTLGTGLGNGSTGPIGALDLYRYSAAGVRSYSTTQTTRPYAYFSVNGGHTVLSYFNQTSGADYGDWLSNPIPAGFAAQVQDAYGARGTNPTLGANELTALNVIGYTLAPVPEPQTCALMLAGMGMLGFIARRRRG